MTLIPKDKSAQMAMVFCYFCVVQELTFTIVKKRVTPLIQFVAALVIGWTGMGICRLAQTHAGEEYLAAFIALIFFCLINVVVSLAYESFLRYTMPCIYLYILLVVILFLSAKQLSGISIWTLYEYRMMLFSISVFYVMASIMVRGVKMIYDAASNEVF
jgi:hypothetical protein